MDKKGENKSEYIAGGNLLSNLGYSHSDRNLDLLVTLTPGVYTVSCIGSWVKGNAYDYSFTFYGNHPVTFTKNYT